MKEIDDKINFIFDKEGIEHDLDSFLSVLACKYEDCFSFVSHKYLPSCNHLPSK
jgi:hypothetical protein